MRKKPDFIKDRRVHFGQAVKVARIVEVKNGGGARGLDGVHEATRSLARLACLKREGIRYHGHASLCRSQPCDPDMFNIVSQAKERGDQATILFGS